MKNRALFLIVLMCLVSAASAQQEGQLFRIVSFDVQLGQQPQWESALQAMMAATGSTYPVFASVRADRPGSYTLAMPIADLNEIAAQGAALQKAADKKPQLMADVTRHTQSISTRVVRARPDLSYAPASPRVAAGEAAYTRAVWLSPHPAKAADAEAMLKELGKIYAKKGLSDSLNVFEQVLGADGPLYVVRVPARDAADAAAQSAKNNALVEKEFLALQKKYGAVMRKVEYRGYVSRPDLGRSGDS